MNAVVRPKSRAWTPPACDVPLLIGGAKLWFMPVKPQPSIWQGIYDFKDGTFARVGEDYESHSFRGPFEVGDELWLRETWAANAFLNQKRPSELFGEAIYYRATHPNESHFMWRATAHMPRWASRCSRRVTSASAVQASSVTHGDMFLAGFKGEMKHNKVMPIETVFRNHIRKVSKTNRDPSLLWLWRIGLEGVSA